MLRIAIVGAALGGFSRRATNLPAVVATGDCVMGDPGQRSFVAVYERHGQPVAVLGMNQPKLFTRWRRQLHASGQVPTTTP